MRPRTLRAQFGKNKIQNAVHCTDLPEDGLLEVRPDLWVHFQKLIFLSLSAGLNYVHPTGGWTYYFCFFQRPPSVTLGFQSFQDKIFIYAMFTKFGMGVYWVNSLHGIAFGEDNSIANGVIAT